ncbi:hypothetical protein SNE25_09750 [Mucilaginibacter sabulilitoris]|uniref:Glycosyl transferase family 1 domain-containing protein n=1 Tax=Mucilaginibacter sabulilitoris TaxID=1173583 RepID=A0ABZ0TXD9_9SPHI|nr:hypothetical protein [Mucilaginibacter sabulilitoris]WPU95800.1 hypothetical protein SNE25_09750 [Mucilaginibacter sabulilitoris]
MVSKTYPTDELNVWIDKTHFDHYQNVSLNLKVNYKKVIQPEKSNKIKWVLKLLSEMAMISQVVYSANKNNAKAVFFSSLSPVGNLYLSLIIPLANNSIKFVIALHGELELSKSNNWHKRIENIYGKALRSSFNKPIKNRKFLILSRIIYNNILKLSLLKPFQMMFIEHPYIFTDIALEQLGLGNTSPIIFGHLGVAKFAKQSQLFFKLAEAMKEYVINGVVHFVVVGPIFEEIKPYVNEFVSYNETADFISRDDYKVKASSLNYSVFFYDEESYELTSSGALMDAIAYEKPIIGLRIKLLETLFDVHSCAPGYIFTDVENLFNSMKRIIEEHDLNYANLVDCIKSKKALFSTDAQFPSFKLQMEEFFVS